MDTSAQEQITTDVLGRRTAPRQQHSIAEKRRIVEETHVRGASVATVARRHGVNPNQVFAWRQLYRQGLLKDGATSASAPLLPVKVSTPTVLPTERTVRAPQKAQRGERASIEIKLANGHSIVVHGRVQGKSLARVIDLLARR
ncbi:MAG: transposase [Gammaproteobacteria bacterium]|nr:transposase [Gammaproteobacteria bacterium]